jgi:hypothetical protein
MRKTIPLALVFIFIAVSGFAFDAGLMLNQIPMVDGNGTDANFSYTGTAVPWFSTLLGENADLYLSLGITAKYDDEELTAIPEIFRFEFNYRPSKRLNLSFGRINHAEPLGYIAGGLFDGAALAAALGNGVIHGGLFYTGFLYKKTAHIVMTGPDQQAFDAPLDYSNFADTYFAARRGVWDVYLEYPGLFLPTGTLFAGLAGQFDFNDADSHYHSQYLFAKYLWNYRSLLELELGAVGEFAENGDTFQVSLAGHLKGSWMPPSLMQDRFYLGARYSLGAVNSTLVAFTPITTKPQGHILGAKLSGLMVIDAGYTARLHPAFSIDVSALYFLRTDAGATFKDVPGTAFALGPEIYGQAIWVPISDISFILGGGAFFPSLGASNPEGKPQWQVSLTSIISF